jgi:hypothetical protein
VTNPKQPTGSTIIEDHATKRQAVADAEKSLTAAIEAHALTGAKILTATDDQLDKAIAASTQADAKVAACRVRFTAAQDRLALAEAAVKKSQVEAGRDELLAAEANLARLDEAVVASVKTALAQLAEPLASLHDARANRNRLIDQLSALGYNALAASDGAAAQRLRITSISPSEALAAVRAGLLPATSMVNVEASVAALVDFIATEPARLVEEKVNAERMEAARASETRQRRLSGQEGPEARDAERALVSQEAASSGVYGKSTSRSIYSSSDLDFASEQISARQLVDQAVP